MEILEIAVMVLALLSFLSNLAPLLGNIFWGQN